MAVYTIGFTKKSAAEFFGALKRAGVKRLLDVFAPGGGFVFNTVHNILPDVPPQNVVAMFEAVDEFNGR